MIINKFMLSLKLLLQNWFETAGRITTFILFANCIIQTSEPFKKEFWGFPGFLPVH